MEPASTTAEFDFTGTVETVRVNGRPDHFVVAVVAVDGWEAPVTVAGVVAGVEAGVTLTGRGHWNQHEKYGWQVRASALSVQPPSTHEGLVRFLAHYVDRIGATRARRLVEAFGEAAVDRVADDPVAAAEVLEVSPDEAEAMQASLVECRQHWGDTGPVREWLAGLGVTEGWQNAIIGVYGPQARERVEDNPYALLRDVPGMGFGRVDRIAQRLGVAADASVRIAGALETELRAFERAGHTIMPQAELVARTTTRAEVDSSRVRSSLTEAVESGRFEQIQGAEQPLVGRRRWVERERQLAAEIRERSQVKPTWLHTDPSQVRRDMEADLGMPFSRSQASAFEGIFASGFAVLSGGPGTGKTTLTRSLLRAWRKQGMKVHLLASTGRAAKRLEEVTGFEARTIHRALEPAEGGSGAGFARNRGNPLIGDVFVVDEVSMCGVDLLLDLLVALPEAASVLLIGDAWQLPSVDPGAVLRDLVASHTAVPVYRLIEVQRTDVALIEQNTRRIREGSPLEFDQGRFVFIEEPDPERVMTRIESLVATGGESLWGDRVADLQVVTPRRTGPLCAEDLNERLIYRVHGIRHRAQAIPWAPGMRVVQTVNNYDLMVFNGEMGVVQWIDREGMVLAADMGDRQVLWPRDLWGQVRPALAITVHRSQGSEYEVVVMPCVREHQYMLNALILGTGISRARRRVVLVGQREALTAALGRELLPGASQTEAGRDNPETAAVRWTALGVLLQSEPLPERDHAL